jgi:hypothetical protein
MPQRSLSFEMMVVAIYALVWSVYAVLMFGAFRLIAPQSPPPSFARTLAWSAALVGLGELAGVAWEPARACVFATGLFLLAWRQVRVGVIRAFVIVVVTMAAWLGFFVVTLGLSHVVSSDVITIAVPTVILGAWAISRLASRAVA